MWRKWYQEKVIQETTLNTKDLEFNRSNLNGPLAGSVNFQYVALPSQGILRQKDNYKSEGSGESQELF